MRVVSVLCVLAAVGLVLCLVFAGAGFLIFVRMCRKRPRKLAYILEQLKKNGDYDKAFLELPWIQARIPSPVSLPSREYSLAVHALKGRLPRVVVLHHGITWNWMACLPQMKAFFDAGWTVVAFDARGHGESGRAHSTFGYYEKQDMRAVCDWALQRFDAREGLVLLGVSLGASTAVQCAGIDPRPVAIIADCPFSSASDELTWHLRTMFKYKILVKALYNFVAFWARRLDAFPMEEADTHKAALASRADILFIHGSDDYFVPWMMSEKMTQDRRAAAPDIRTELALFQGADHAMARRSNPERYCSLIVDFANEAAERAQSKAALQ